MGKQTDNSRNNAEPDDYELKVLIDKCNVCHSNSDTDHHKMCKHHGEHFRFIIVNFPQPSIKMPHKNF